MFCQNCKLGLVLKGVFNVKGKSEVRVEKGRRFSALSLRIKGNSEIKCADSRYCLQDGSIAYFPTGVDYRRETKGDEEMIVVHFNAFGEDEKAIQVVEHCEKLHPFFETLLNTWENGEYNRCMQTVYQIFDEIALMTSESSREIPEPIRAGVAYMEKYFRNDDLTIAAAAAQSHVSETYFRKLFGEYFGISPVQWLIEKRFHYAKSLLRSGYYQIKEIASLSGFSETKYFRTAFKKRFGETPNEYSSRYSFG